MYFRIVVCEDAKHALEKYDEMIELLQNLEDKIFNKWTAEIPDICTLNLAKTLFLIDPDTKLLSLNFSEQVRK